MMTRLNDDELNNISGGVREDNPDLPTWGYDIHCPDCKITGRKEEIDRHVFYDPQMDSVEYRCKTCNTKFICYKKNVILKDAWIQECLRHTPPYIYPNP